MLLEPSSAMPTKQAVIECDDMESKRASMAINLSKKGVPN
jgi:hypothetical protein